LMTRAGFLRHSGALSLPSMSRRRRPFGIVGFCDLTEPATACCNLPALGSRAEPIGVNKEINIRCGAAGHGTSEVIEFMANDDRNRRARLAHYPADGSRLRSTLNPQLLSQPLYPSINSPMQWLNTVDLTPFVCEGGAGDHVCPAAPVAVAVGGPDGDCGPTTGSAAAVERQSEAAEPHCRRPGVPRRGRSATPTNVSSDVSTTAV